MAKKTFWLGMMILGLLLGSCATIFNNKQTAVSASSGSNRQVTILENGSVVYQGSLPATINVNGSNNYVVQYTDDDGNQRMFQLQKKVSGWFIADILLIGGWIIDLITGDVMVYDKVAIIPINYSDSQQGLLVEYIPDVLQEDLRIIGNIYN
jgi:hypothetical protein